MFRIVCCCGVALLASSMVLAAEVIGDLPKSHKAMPELYATGFEFAEGPALDAAGNLYVVNYRHKGTIGKITPDGTAKVFCILDELAPVEGSKSQANGLKVDSEGRLVVADAGIGRVLRIATDGKSAEVLAERFADQRFKSINEVALDRQGNIYFTDPGGSSVENPIGAVYRYDINTKKVKQVANNLAFPNGLGITPDQKQLVVAESKRYRLLIFDLLDDGEVTNQRVLYEFPLADEGNLRGGKFEPNGLIFDKQGRCYVAMGDGGVINVIDVASGKLLRQYDAGGANATNCHFHGPYLYVTVAAKEAVFRLELGVEGFNYAPEQ